MSENEEFQEASNQPVPSISDENQKNKRKRTEEPNNPDDTTANVLRRIQDTNVPSFRAYRKINVKLVRCEHHLGYLNKCISRDTIPKTLRINIKPQVPDTTPLCNIPNISDEQSSLCSRRDWEQYPLRGEASRGGTEPCAGASIWKILN